MQSIIGFLKIFFLSIVLTIFVVGEISVPSENETLPQAYPANDEGMNEVRNDVRFLKTAYETLKTHTNKLYELLEKQDAKLNLIIKSKEENIDKARVIDIEIPKKKYPSNCAEATLFGGTSGIYSIKVETFSSKPFLVYCNTERKGGGWTVIQRRKDGSENFYRKWADYKKGFGNLEREFFIGLDKLHAMTTESPQKLLIHMETFDGEEAYAQYDFFGIEDESEAYRLSVLGEYSGDAGDSLSYHASQNFSTFDRDNNIDSALRCAEHCQGAWWYQECSESNLNGPYIDTGEIRNFSAGGQGIHWSTWKDYEYSLKFVEMLIKPKM